MLSVRLSLPQMDQLHVVKLENLLIVFKYKGEKKMSYAKRIKMYRKKQGITQRKFADLLGVKSSVVCNIENNKYNVSEKLGNKIDAIIYKPSKKDMAISVSQGNAYSFDKDNFIVTNQQVNDNVTKTTIMTIPYNSKDPVHEAFKDYLTSL